ncbi:MAG: insulinase family protein [Nitrospirae bacterium]|nr:insulinase family protein [Nitrospirota bacterium]
MKRFLPIVFIVALIASGCATANTMSDTTIPKPQAVREPIGERYELGNGMVLLVKENHALPVVMVNMIIKAGAVNETPDKAGLAHMTAGLLTKGASGMSATEISEAIEFVGGSLSVGGGGDYATASLSVLKKDADTGFDLLGKVLMKPAFDQSEIDRLRKSVKAGIIRSEQEPASVASKAFARAVYGEKHPYGIPTEGTLDTIDGITKDDISKFHTSHFVPNNTIMAVVGDITADEAKALVEKHLAGLENYVAPVPSFPATPEPKGREWIMVDRDITQANIMMGHLGVRREDPDYYKLQVMNYILGGGGFVSRILDKIRDDMGLAYSAYSYFGPRKFDGEFTAGLETKNESAKLAIDETLNLVEQMRAEPVTDKELQDAKDYITGSFPRKTDTNAKIAGLLTQVEFFNLGLDYFDTYEREVMKVTKEDVQDVARKYLHPDNLYIVVVGKLKEVGE